MKKALLLSVLVNLLLFSTQAAEGDTTFIQSHNETHWDWNGSKYDTAMFPEIGEYRRVLMYYTLGCPAGGCSGWDYTTKIEVEDPIDDSTSRWVELTRIITPYAGDKGPDWKHTWEIDVTDYAPILKGERVINARYQGWEDGFTVSIRFAFIEGTPPRNVLAVNTIYDGTFKYGDVNDPIEDHLVPTEIDVHPDLGSARFRMVASGHSFGGNENCAEFCKKWYRLYIDNMQAVHQDVWRDDCGANPLQGQTGTWIYNRAGWCPGDVTTRYDEEVGFYLQPNGLAEFDVNWQSFTNQGTANPQYIVETTLFQYEDWNFSNDLAIDKVISPSMDDRSWEINPICNNPVIVVSNTGSENISSASFEYWTEGSRDKVTYNWSAPLLPGQSATVELESINRWLFGSKTDNIFYAVVTSVNGVDDEYEGNNLIKSRFEDTEMFPSEIIVYLDNNAASNETRYKIENDKGEVVFERSESASNATYNDTIQLEMGCYTLKVRDTDCDGLGFFNNSDGNGNIRVHNAEDGEYFPALHTFDREFGCDATLSFTVGYELGDNYPEGMAALTSDFELIAYPNPAPGHITLAVDGEFEQGQMTIFNTMGQLVMTEKLTNRNGIEINDLAAGQYIAEYKTQNGLKTIKFSILR